MKFVETVSVCHGAQPARFTRHNAAKQIKGCAPFPRPLFKTPKTDRRTMPIFSPRSAKFFSNRGFFWIFPTEIVEPEKRVYTCMYVRVCVCTYMIRRKKEKKRERKSDRVFVARRKTRVSSVKGFHEFQPFYFTRTRIFCSMLRDSSDGIVRQLTPIFHFSVARFSREATLIRDSFIVLLWLYFIYSSDAMSRVYVRTRTRDFDENRVNRRTTWLCF